MKSRYKFYAWIYALDPITFEPKRARGYVNGETKKFLGCEVPKITIIGRWQDVEIPK